MTGQAGSPPDDDILAALRHATRDGHARIERLLGLAEPMPLARYAEIIAGFATWLRAWEPQVREALPDRLRPWFDVRRRAPFALADLEWLREHRALSPHIDGEAAAKALPLEDLADALGSLYVIEGSALGARVIAPRLRDDLGLVAGAGASYFHGFGDEAGALWRDFRSLAAREVPDAQDVLRACLSARRTFESLLETFRPLQSDRRI